jgi:lipopolysaccharide export LptBFGC system permease protein LptF
MYAALWRMLPGGVFLKLIQLMIILVIVVFVLFEWVFPWLAQTFLSEQSTVE